MNVSTLVLVQAAVQAQVSTPHQKLCLWYYSIFSVRIIPHNVRINAISPGTIATKFHEQYSTPEKLENTRLKIPMKRLGTAEDCVGPIIFLSSNKLSGYITGQILEINGGQFIS